jgi:serine/threonine protein kinase
VNPFVIKDRPEEKQLGISTRSLCVNDFTLIKTLGTGTFARVWLAKFKDEKIRRDNVYALKVLRKADVIKLKQVEHVRNERKALAAVAGHPFITTLIATFSDEQSLYMLVCKPPRLVKNGPSHALPSAISSPSYFYWYPRLTSSYLAGLLPRR